MDYEGKTWRILTNLWTIATIFLFAYDFFSGNRIDASAGAIGAIYIAILSIYVGTKEFERWHSHYSAHYFGEIYIIIWTIFVLIVSLIAPFTQNRFIVPTELVVVYTVVLSIFAISRRSKHLYFRRQNLLTKPLSKIKKYVKVIKRNRARKNI